MLDEVKSVQNKAIYEIINEISIKDEIVFKAPTGAGKTFIMARVMDELLHSDDSIVFIVSSLSKAGLAQQNYDKFCEYLDLGLINDIKPYLISSESSGENSIYIPSHENVYVLPRDLYKDDSKLKKQQALKKFLFEIEDQNRKIYLIKDECHIATNNLDTLKSHFLKVINVSATPKKQQKVTVEISEKDVMSASIIKRVKYHSKEQYSDNDFAVNSIQYKELLKALDNFKVLKNEYLKVSNINPCLIIQISNKVLGEEQFKVIEHALSLSDYKDLKWVSYATDSKLCKTNDQLIKAAPSKWEKYAKPNDSTIDIIIFKMAITEGWDIPRANMLFQIRDSKSSQLDAQVLGRVRRNPRLMDFEKITDTKVKDLFTIAHVWGIKEKDEVNTLIDVRLKGKEPLGEYVKNEIQEELKVKITKLANLNHIRSKFDIEEFLENKENIQPCKSIFELHRALEKTSIKVKDECYKYMLSYYGNEYSRYFNFVNNLDEIKSKIKTMYMSDTSSIEVVKKPNNNEDLEVSLPYNSLYYKNNKFVLTGLKGVWESDSDLSEFSFDSDSEKIWLYKLVNDFDSCIKRIYVEDSKDVLLIGKNYLQNSEIKYEYYADGSHFSYPDFILKDKNNRVFLFEVKSVNISNSKSFNSEEYLDKVRILKDLYFKVSSKVNHYFCLPILNGNTWTVFCYYNGEGYELNYDQFKSVVVNKDFDLSNFKKCSSL